MPSNGNPEQRYKAEQYKTEQFKSEQSNGSTPAPRAVQPANEVPVKQEQGIKYETAQNYQPQQGYGGLNPQFARERANHLLHQQYGSQADASIQAAQARQMQMPSGQQRPAYTQMPPRPGQPSYPQQQPPLSTAQTDGAADNALVEWKAALAERRALSEQDRSAADHKLRDYLEQLIAFEDVGLLLPASEQSRKSKKRRNVPISAMPVDSTASTPSAPGRFDGPDEEDNKDNVKKQIEEDEDAINSDLDDPDEELENVDDEDGADGPMGETILCTYDKVQRVKNKACTACHLLIFVIMC